MDIKSDFLGFASPYTLVRELNPLSLEHLYLASDAEYVYPYRKGTV